MSRVTLSIVAGVCLAIGQSGQAQNFTILPTDDPSTITFATETGNNTSACVASGSPLYCNDPLPNLQTSAANQTAGAQTTVVDALPEHVSTLNAKRLLYPGWTGQLICEYEPWFSNDGGTSHIDIGYDEHNTATIAGQDSTMISRGCNINLISFYGSTSTSSDLVFDRVTTDTVFGDLAGRGPTYPLKFAVLEDVGAFQSACSNQSESQTISCIETDLEADMKYIHNNYAQSTLAPVYWVDQEKYVIGYFGACADFPILSCPNDWNTIWTAVQDYVDGNNYGFKFIFEFGNFDVPSISAGEYAWPQPYTDSTDNDAFVDNPTSQFWWCDPNGVTCTGNSNGYLDSFYQQAADNYTTKLSVGLLYSGFDDSNASWGVDRVIAQQCGQVLLDTANEVTAGGFWGTTNQMPYMQIATWNDYEEGTEQESGVDNCYTAVNTTLTGTVMSWTLTVAPGQSSYATNNTIHHYALWTATPNGSTLTLRKQLTHTTTSFDLSTLGLASGTYAVYLEMIGQPSMQNEMSNEVTYTQE